MDVRGLAVAADDVIRLFNKAPEGEVGPITLLGAECLKATLQGVDLVFAYDTTCTAGAGALSPALLQ